MPLPRREDCLCGRARARPRRCVAASAASRREWCLSFAWWARKCPNSSITSAVPVRCIADRLRLPGATNGAGRGGMSWPRLSTTPGGADGTRQKLAEDDSMLPPATIAEPVRPSLRPTPNELRDGAGELCRELGLETELLLLPHESPPGNDNRLGIPHVG
mmetsp:Transcript_97142/g.187233  ORF Transcript_97142/g.187233 Transcript_97142/m.187233 type:complete len:160 (-) Transcript_97142:65-544(-)